MSVGTLTDLTQLLTALLVGVFFTFFFMRQRQKQLEQQIAQHSEDQEGLRRAQDDLLRAEERLKSLESLKLELGQLGSLLDQERQSSTRHSVRTAELETLLEQERKASDEKLRLLEDARKKMAVDFENLANKVLDTTSQKFTEQNKVSIGSVLTPLREQMESFRKRVDQIHQDETKDRGALTEQLRQLETLNQRINQEAANLTNALKGNKKTQGDWGEMILETVLNDSGLRKGIEFETQTGHKDEGNRLYKPDVIIHLPDNKDIIIDSKVSLVDYNTYMNAEDDRQCADALGAHIKAIRNHIDTLNEKDYSSLKGIRSLDVVIMFIPIEGASIAAFQGDDSLFRYALERKIAIVTPSTLLPTLRTIESIWRYERQNENARRIASKAAVIYDKFRGFLEDMERLGSQIQTTQKTYDGAMNKLTHGTGNLIRQTEQFREMGVKVKKEIPKSILDRTDMGPVSLTEIESDGE